MIFKRKISKHEAEQALRDEKMRRRLLEFLQDGTKPEGMEHWPEPMRDDGGVIGELKRILRLK